MGKCTNCNNWNTFVEEVKQPETNKTRATFVTSGQKPLKIKEVVSEKEPRMKTKKTRATFVTSGQKPLKIKEVVSEKEPRMKTKMQETNRVLGGGIVPGSLVLIGGDPGIGKSTLLLQTSAQIAELGQKVLYVS